MRRLCLYKVQKKHLVLVRPAPSHIVKHYKGKYLFLISKQKAKNFYIFFAPIYKARVGGRRSSVVAAIGARWRSSVQLLDPRKHRAHLGDPGRDGSSWEGLHLIGALHGATMCRASDMCRDSPMCADSQGFAATFADSRRFAQLRGDSWKFVAFCATSWPRSRIRRQRPPRRCAKTARVCCTSTRGELKMDLSKGCVSVS